MSTPYMNMNRYWKVNSFCTPGILTKRWLAMATRTGFLTWSFSFFSLSLTNSTYDSKREEQRCTALKEKSGGKDAADCTCPLAHCMTWDRHKSTVERLSFVIFSVYLIWTIHLQIYSALFELFVFWPAISKHLST